MIKDKSFYEFLLIEDNLGDALLIKEYLTDQFSTSNVTIARNYKETLKILENKSLVFDTILLDLSLPDKDGESLITEIVSHPKILCPVIILTGYADVEFSIKSISLGISDYLLKDELTAIMLYKSIIYAIERCDFKNRLQESEKKFSLLFNLSPQPMWVYDIESLKFIYVNEAAINHYGYSKEEFFAIDPIQLYRPEDRADIEKTIRYVDKKKLSFSGSFKQVKKSGEEIEVEIYSTLLVIDESPCRTIIAIDVTEKNRAEIRLTEAIIKSQEEERYAIGGELHDNICQILAGSMLSLSTLKSTLSDDKANIFSQGINNIKLASNEIRNLSHRLAPAFFDDMDLRESMSQLITSINIEGKFKTHLIFGKELETISLKRDLQINLYRICRSN